MRTHSGGFACLFVASMRVLLMVFLTRRRILGAAAVGVMSLVAGSALAQLPGAATPGGAFPNIPDTDLSPPADQEIFPIPPVIDRPLAIDEGDRLFVSKFVLKGGVDRPDQGILIEELKALLENRRLEAQGLTAVGGDGFTDEERSEIANFMNTVVADPDWGNRLADYESLVDRLRQERLDREVGMTLGEMQELANAITQYYRNAGFILAQAFIPAQEVAEGVVTIEVLEGTLGSVLVEGNENFSDDVLAAPFQELIDAPVAASSVESSILLLTDLAGLGVFGVFQPGTQVGTSDLLLRVQQEDRWDATARYDNHGTRFTGRNRLFAEFTYNNPTWVGDRLSGSILQQYNPKNSFFGSLEYERPILIPGLTVTGSYSRNFFDVGAEFGDVNISGVSKVGTVFARYAVLRSRQKNFYVQAGMSRKQSLTKVDEIEVAKDDLSMFEGSVSFDLIDPDTRSVNIGSFGTSVGMDELFGGMGDAEEVAQRPLPPTRTTGTGKFADNTFLKFNADFSRIQSLYGHLSVILRTEGQWSPHLLTSLEQYHIGGPTNVRAYPPSEFLMDSAFFGSVEFEAGIPPLDDVASPFKNLNWSEVLHVSFFTDYAYGRLHSPGVGDETSISVGGFGLGMSLAVPGEFIGRLQWAYPTSDTRIPSDRNMSHWWFDLPTASDRKRRPSSR